MLKVRVFSLVIYYEFIRPSVGFTNFQQANEQRVINSEFKRLGKNKDVEKAKLK